MMDFARHLGDVMRDHRKRLGFSQESFADHIGMHRTYYGAFERGEKNLQVSTLHRVADGFQVGAGQMFLDAEQSAVVANARRLTGLPKQGLAGSDRRKTGRRANR